MQYCARPGCHVLVERGSCRDHARAKDQQRPNVDVRRWYSTSRWRALRAQVLREEPLCVDCIEQNRTTPSTDVDHEVPHRGAEGLFWDRGNLHGRCHSCHSRKTQRGE